MAKKEKEGWGGKRRDVNESTYRFNRSLGFGEAMALTMLSTGGTLEHIAKHIRIGDGVGGIESSRARRVADILYTVGSTVYDEH